MTTMKIQSPRSRGGHSVAVATAAVALALSAALPATAASDSTQASARAQIKISGAAAFDAPIGARGGISNPVASCPNYRVEPKTAWTLANTDTGLTHTYRWTGSFPGMYFPRVPVGTYKSTTTARCHRNEKTRVETVTIKEKTLDGTVSRAEWRQIRRGMTRAEVADIVGSGGRDPSRGDGKLTVTYDMMKFWRWSLISYREGRVVDKYWNVGHD